MLNHSNMNLFVSRNVEAYEENIFTFLLMNWFQIRTSANTFIEKNDRNMEGSRNVQT